MVRRGATAGRASSLHAPQELEPHEPNDPANGQQRASAAKHPNSPFFTYFATEDPQAPVHIRHQEQELPEPVKPLSTDSQLQ